MLNNKQAKLPKNKNKINLIIAIPEIVNKKIC